MFDFYVERMYLYLTRHSYCDKILSYYLIGDVMGIVELLLIAIGLSMDAFAVAICKGLKMPKLNYNQAFVIALFFGGFQAFMPLLGWFLSKNFEVYITNVDHWIAFVLLALIGGKMVYESFKDEDESGDGFDLKELFFLAIATSIDALAVGITFAFLKVEIFSSVTIIGITTFLFSLAGVGIGHKFGAKFEKKAELAGGIILILIGLKVLLEHTGIINF